MIIHNCYLSWTSRSPYVAELSCLGNHLLYLAVPHIITSHLVVS